MLSLAVVLIILTAVTGSGIMVAILMTIANRLKMLESGGSGPAELNQLAREVDNLRAELETASSDIGNLTERLDFTERLLSDGPDS